jgi:HD-GYP domain-containing protein (c-di-GMP phosphodiesterase class II)
MRLVPIYAIKDGAFLAQNLYNENGQILLSKGVKINERYKKKIKEHGFSMVYILDEYSQNEIEDVIKPEIRQKMVQTIRSTFNTLTEFNYQNANAYKKDKLAENVSKNIEAIQDIANNIVEEICSQRNIMISLVDIKNSDSYTYRHSVNVGILSLVLGISYELNKNDLCDLVMGSILHDIGKVFIPNEILMKKGKLTPEEFQIIQEHPARGFHYLKDYSNLNAKARIIVLQHQERIDGSGYPYGLKGDQIYIFSKIAAVADIYDALTSDRPYRSAVSPNEAVEFIMGAGGTYFDIDVVKAFAKKVIPYPIGTLVRLSNQSIGVIEKINDDFILRPVVKIIRENNKKVEPFLCDLKYESNIIIEGIVYDLHED